ncbi:MAG TPA: hypothetical protein GXX46_03365 [Peptococcaceae bacterium]|nr:hypothetical protein [Peptococcaceae bacterium]
MNKNLTELVFILDKSGSMAGLESDTIEKVKELVEKQKEKYGWEFIFLGANIDAIGTAARFGISANRAVNYHADSRGTMLNFISIGEAVSFFRANDIIDDKWKEKIEEDFQSRSKKDNFKTLSPGGIPEGI